MGNRVGSNPTLVSFFCSCLVSSMDELFNFPSRFYYIFLRNWLNNDTGWQFWKLDVGNPGKKMQSK